RDPCALIHHKGRWNATLPRRLHPGLSHFALLAAGQCIERYAIGHLIAHLFDEWRHRVLVLLPHILSNDDQAFVFEPGMNLVEVRDRNAAGSAPGGPEFDNVNFAALETVDGFALHPFRNLKFRRGIADFERRLGGVAEADAGQHTYCCDDCDLEDLFVEFRDFYSHSWLTFRGDPVNFLKLGTTPSFVTEFRSHALRPGQSKSLQLHSREN